MTEKGTVIRAMRYVGGVAFLAASYVATAQLGQLIALDPDQALPVWPPIGIAVAALWLFGRNLWPGIVIGSALVSLAAGLPVPATLCLAAGATLAPLLGVSLLLWRKVDPSFREIRDVKLFAVLAVLLATAAGATLGVAGLCLGGVSRWSEYGMLWWNWWLADAPGMLLVTPVLLSWYRAPARTYPRRYVFEALWLAVILACGGALMAGGSLPVSAEHVFVYAVFPLVIWAALRFGQRGAATASLLVSIIAVAATASGIGPFESDNPADTLALLQVFMSMVTLTALLLAAALTERDNAMDAARLDGVGRGRAEEALRESEMWLRAITDNSPAVIFLKSAEGRYLLVNRSYERLFNLKAADILGKTDFDLFDHSVASMLLDNDSQVLAERMPVEFEEVVPDPDQVPHTYISLKVPLFGRDGVPYAVCGISTDITERKHGEVVLREAKETAEIANRSKSEFLANMSHELRTPLNAILGFSEIMGAEMFGPLGDGKYLDYVKDIHDSGNHLLEMINDILDVSKIEAGRMDLLESEFDLGRIAESCLRLVQERAQAAGLDLRTEIAADLPRLCADERRIKQVFLNLLSNAVKFTPKGGTVIFRAFHDPSGKLVVEVEDTGIGIAAEDMPKVMMPFGQVDSRLARRYEGSGLGLPLAQGIITLHGGTLALTSEPNQGTTVTVHLPAERLAREAAERV